MIFYHEPGDGRLTRAYTFAMTQFPFRPSRTALALSALLIVSCTSAPVREPSSSLRDARPTAPAVATVTVPESFVSTEAPGDELDSLSTWPTQDGGTWLLATAKSSHRLVVFDADSGQRLRTVGGRGAAAGQFDRPNGIAVHGDQLFVVERDNRRVQVLSLPGFTPLGTFGDAELRSPYGIWVHETAPDRLEAYITDNFMYGKGFDVVPSLAELDQRVRRYRIESDAEGSMQVKYLGSFGDTSPQGALRMVESIAGDPAHTRLLIAEEDTGSGDGRTGSTLREYSFGGRYSGRSLPGSSFAAEAEGVALWSCRDGGGYWLAVDQMAPLTVFHLFDRETLAHRGSFKGEVTSYTDGIALHAAGTTAFPAGALYAVHADKAVAAFDLGEVARVLGLSPACTE